VPCSFELLQQYFLANKQYFSLTANQHKPNLSETNMAVRPKHYPREAISDRVFYSLAVNPSMFCVRVPFVLRFSFPRLPETPLKCCLKFVVLFRLNHCTPSPRPIFMVWAFVSNRTHAMAHSANEMKMDLLTAQLCNANG